MPAYAPQNFSSAGLFKVKPRVVLLQAYYAQFAWLCTIVNAGDDCCFAANYFHELCRPAASLRWVRFPAARSKKIFCCRGDAVADADTK